VLLTADWLVAMHNRRLPRQLSGDYRTAPANAMRPMMLPSQRHARRNGLVVGNPPPFADFGLPHNPNRGAAREKRLGIPDNWHHPLRVEMWQMSRGVKRCYMVCPSPRNCMRVPPGRGKRPGRHREDDMTDWGKWCLNRGDCRVAALSRIERGSKLNQKVCPQRVLKLFMVMCSPEELADAHVAQTWINSIPSAIVNRHQAHISVLERRYGILFEPRRLLCQRCLGVRYNQGPERRRKQHARRKGRVYGELAAASNGVGASRGVRIEYGVSGAYVATGPIVEEVERPRQPRALQRLDTLLRGE
jgi:hypothetical protein